MQQLDFSSVQLNEYSGPLDLLLRLIQKREMDIFHIDISQITAQYLRYLSEAPQPDPEQAGEFIKTAVLLMYIKSKTLVPDEPGAKEDSDEGPDELKKNLTRLLIQYQVFKKAGEMLYERDLLGRDLWPSGLKSILKPVSNDEIEVKQEEAPFIFMKNCQKILIDERKKRPLSASMPSFPSLVEWIQDLLNVLTPRAKIFLSRLSAFQKKPHSKLLTFLSLLELSKTEALSLSQKDPFSDILVTVKKPPRSVNLKDIERNAGVTGASAGPAAASGG